MHALQTFMCVTPVVFWELFTENLADGTPLAFAVGDAARDAIVGTTQYLISN